MEQNEFTEENVKVKAAPQFNARIGEDLKQVIDEIGRKTGKSKPELLDEFVRVYQTKKADDEFSDMDLTKYDNLSNPLKESVHNAFNHILNAVNGNLATLKQSAIHIEEEKKGLTEREKEYKAEIEFIKSNSARELLVYKEEKEELQLEMNSKIALWKDKTIDLEARNIELHKEFDNVNKIAEQVQVVTAENKDLRESTRELESGYKASQNELNDQIKTLSEELIEVRQSVFRADLDSDSKDKVIKSLKEDIAAEKKESMDEQGELKKQLLSAMQELSDTQNVYNKALGKLEVLEKSL